MKKLKIWKSILLFTMALSLMVSCSGDSDNDAGNGDKDAFIPFTNDLIVGGWKIVSSTSSKSDFKTGSTALFIDNGACLGFHSTETYYKLNEGKIYTLYNKTHEPMYTYTLHSINELENDTILDIRVNGTLDDNSSFEITVKKFEEFPDWKNKNEQEFMSRYMEGKDLMATSQKWAVVNSYTGIHSSPTDYIVMQILDAGAGNSKPHYTDSVAIHYRGRLLPSASYSQGLVIDQTFTGSYNPSNSMPHKGKVSNFIEGFATALLQMKRGSHCVIYIPYQLAYGGYGISYIPAYSMLIYEVWLEDFWTRERGINSISN